MASIQTLADGNIAAFYQLFDDNLKKELSQQELQTLWNDLISQYGAFQYYQSDITITSKDNNQIASVPCVFANGTVTFQLTFNDWIIALPNLKRAGWVLAVHCGPALRNQTPK